MWYVVVNNRVLPTPYQSFSDALTEANRLQWSMCAVSTKVIFEDELGNY